MNKSAIKLALLGSFLRFYIRARQGVLYNKAMQGTCHRIKYAPKSSCMVNKDKASRTNSFFYTTLKKRAKDISTRISQRRVVLFQWQLPLEIFESGRRKTEFRLKTELLLSRVFDLRHYLGSDKSLQPTSSLSF